MEIRRVDAHFAVAPQLQAGDMTRLADEGFTTIICNRPDGEEPGQPPVADIAEAATAAGLAFYFIPVSGGEFPDNAVSAFREVRQKASGPVLAFCRTGTRSITLETLANPDDRSVEDRLSRAAGAGYDLQGLAESLAG
ncbi:TIGR01244 family sulfur transferase [Croceicoccus mobilis]|uniref:Beta-lactamase hydrolase-like protein phosphatase-like domain-containing protein n=1 Tax=Croceicoccus mobilis TaxID=1703339 RepID=A0A916Z054_9SPHN|nr:TIGR01244 family sulfur transferase [Croceicoccus mobilis]GGD69881.1 hypothetical protein GCM10010990_19240 [Croceicoccus mobilis]